MPLETVAEIVPMAALVRPPNKPALIEGLLNLAGTAVPVLRLDRLFGLAEQEAGLYTPLLVVRSKAGLVALWVDHVAEVLATSESPVLPVEPGCTFNGCVDAVLGAAACPIHVLAIERILLEKERHCMAEFQVREQKRLDELEEVGA